MKSIPVLPWNLCWWKTVLTKWGTLMLEISSVHCGWKAAYTTSTTVRLRKTKFIHLFCSRECQRHAKLYANIWIYHIQSRKHLCVYVRELYHFRRVSDKLFLPSFWGEWLEFFLLWDEQRITFEPLYVSKFLQEAFVLLPTSFSCKHKATQRPLPSSRVFCSSEILPSNLCCFANQTSAHMEGCPVTPNCMAEKITVHQAVVKPRTCTSLHLPIYHNSSGGLIFPSVYLTPSTGTLRGRMRKTS